MEVGGFVLGGIPLILWALENYRMALNPAKDYWRYESTLQTIKMNIFIQQEQLDVTLHNIGLQGATWAEVELHLRRRYPEMCDTFMDILEHMDSIVRKLMEKLVTSIPRASESQPNGEAAAPGRVEWEWRRVKRSFGITERHSLVEELQYWNNALKNCFEKQEIPSDEGDRTVQELQARFDPNQCDTVRDNARAVHKALESGLGCLCMQPHGGHFHLNWHEEKILCPSIFNLSLSYRKAKRGTSSTSDERWKSMSVRIEKAPVQPPVSNSNGLSLMGVKTPDMVNHSPSPSKKTRFRDLLAKSRSKTKSEIGSQRSNQLTSFQTLSISQDKLQLPRSPTPSSISSLCQVLQGCTTSEYLGCLSDSSTSRQIQIHTTSSESASPRMMSPTALLSPSNHQFVSQLGLSRKQRFGIAASIVWAVLFLCDSPWLSDRLDKDELQIMLDNDYVRKQDIPEGVSCVAHRFTSASTQPTSSASSTPLTTADQFQNSQIRNKTLFALGILLIQLCLNRPFSELRRESQIRNQTLNGTGTQAGATGTVLEDFAIAEAQTDKV